MRCDDVVVNLPDYLLGKIEPNLCKCIERHLETCARCSAELEEMREPVRLLGEAGYEEYPETFWDELQSSIIEKVTKPAPAVRWKVPAFAGALAALLLIIGVGLFQLSRKPASKSEPTSIVALAASLSPEQAAALPSMNVNYIDAVSSQASVFDEIDAVDDSLQQAIVNAMWNSVGDSTNSAEAFDYLGNTYSN